MMRRLKVLIGLVVSVFIGLYISECYWRIAKPKRDIVLDLRGVQSDKVLAGVFDDNGTVKSLSKVGESYQGKLTWYEKEAELSVTVQGRRVTKASLNGTEFPKAGIVAVGDATFLRGVESDFAVLVTPKSEERLAVELVSGILIGLVLFVVWRMQGRCWFVYGPEVFSVVTAHQIAIAALVCAATVFSVVGVDAKPIYYIVQLFNHGVDVYQFQVVHKAIDHFEFLHFPYNPSMLIFLGLVDAVLDPLTNLLPVYNSYPYLQILVSKFLNFGLIFLTCGAIASFLLKHGFVKAITPARFWLAVFNPLVFYIGILYVQYDTVPAYFITLGLLNLASLVGKGGFSGLVTALGISMKMQCFLLAPLVAGTAVFTGIFAAFSRARVRWFLKYSIAAAVVLIASYLLIYRSGTPFHFLLSNFSQKERIWFTVLHYAPGLVLFLAPLSILVATGVFLGRLNDTTTDSQIPLQAVLGIGAVVCAFSMMHMYTPSTFLQLTAPIALVVLSGSAWQAALACVWGCFIAANWAFCEIGDISRVFGYQTAVFTKFFAELPEADRLRLNSLLFTAGVAGMAGLIGLFMQRSRALSAARESRA
jgi:hypothetical protein